MTDDRLPKEFGVPVETVLADAFERLEREDPVGQLVHKHDTIESLRAYGLDDDVIADLLGVKASDLPTTRHAPTGSRQATAAETPSTRKHGILLHNLLVAPLVILIRMPVMIPLVALARLGEMADALSDFLNGVLPSFLRPARRRRP